MPDTIQDIAPAPGTEGRRLPDLRILSGSALKVIAVLAMVVDHVAAFLLYDNPALSEPLFAIGHKQVTLYLLMRSVGRIAFPLFCYLVVEGFVHTRSRVRYGASLLGFALVSEIPWNLVHSGTMLHPTQNVFFTLLLGFLGLCAVEYFKDDRTKMAVSVFALLVASVLLRSDYGCAGYGFILMLYALRDRRILQAAVGCCILPGRWIAGAAFIPISMYNGRRGFVKGPVAKYFFYVFYPLHLLVLYWLRTGGAGL